VAGKINRLGTGGNLYDNRHVAADKEGSPFLCDSINTGTDRRRRKQQSLVKYLLAHSRCFPLILKCIYVLACCISFRDEEVV